MEGDANHTAPSNSLPRHVTEKTTSSSSSSSSFSPPSLIRNVQAALKRHHPLGTMQANNIKPRRTLVARRGTPINSASTLGPSEDIKGNQNKVSSHQGQAFEHFIAEKLTVVPGVDENQMDASITVPSSWGMNTNTYEENKPFNGHRDQNISLIDYKSNEPAASAHVESHVQLVDGQKKVQFLLGDTSGSHEMDIDISNQPEAAPAISLRPDVTNPSSLSKRTMELHNQLHQFRNFLHGDVNLPITQSSAAGSSCATSTLVNSASAPVMNSTTYEPHPHQTHHPNKALVSLGDDIANSRPITQENAVQPTCPSSCSTSTLPGQTPDQALPSGADLAKEPKDKAHSEADFRKDSLVVDDKLSVGIGPSSNATETSKQALCKNPSKIEPPKAEKQDKSATNKVAPRKRGYDPDLFFKVSGKLYQRLGKIGSGGSSEVHKVISSDCQIFALKKIKLKGRDYATAYGFCQEIQYLNKLKGKSNIIQLIDYEVTDKTLLREVLNGSMSNRDGTIKEDEYIYMVLEYGEIDLAHMLSHKWKEMDNTNSTIDDNWLRFYWQQILLAVNTIHEERIVHSDLKPANFLLVRGSLKLIDFGIAKAIMSDTTHIQRDSQVGTLSYMSPEAFMCNETDANGNTIKCGRPSDIWSLGCILYQMVYGRTPFSEYKTFWAKFKVITDPNYKITYEPVSNPWLLDLMKNCLAWNMNDRWRIPQLLKHPFLVPPIAPELPSPEDQTHKLLQLVAESFSQNPKALSLCRQLEDLLMDPR